MFDADNYSSEDFDPNEEYEGMITDFKTAMQQYDEDNIHPSVWVPTKKQRFQSKIFTVLCKLSPFKLKHTTFTSNRADPTLVWVTEVTWGKLLIAESDMGVVIYNVHYGKKKWFVSEVINTRRYALLRKVFAFYHNGVQTDIMIQEFDAAEEWE